MGSDSIYKNPAKSSLTPFSSLFLGGLGGLGGQSVTLPARQNFPVIREELFLFTIPRADVNRPANQMHRARRTPQLRERSLDGSYRIFTVLRDVRRSS
jgi:hypothetical protein